MKEHPILMSAPMVRAILEGRKTQTRRVVGSRLDPYINSIHTSGVVPQVTDCYLKPGDRLWVRETWRVHPEDLAVRHILKEDMPIEYRATPIDGGHWDGCKWKPSIFMPRWASRILLEITEVRVERLQEISRADVIAEGTTDCPDPLCDGPCWHEYAELWDSINGKGAWDANPWVWVVGFKKVTDG